MFKEKLKSAVKRMDAVFLSDRISRWRALRTVPASVVLDVSGSCNLNCTICSLREWFPKTGPKTIAPEVVARIAAYVKNIRQITLQCNCEPLINPEAPSIIRTLKKENPALVVSLVTNGTLLSEERSRQLIESGIDEVSISIDGATAETYERVRKGASFDRVIENIGIFNRLRELDGTGKVKLGVITVLTKENLSELPAIFRLAAGLRADSYYVNGLEAYSEGLHRSAVYGPAIDRNAEKVFKTVRALARQYRIALSLPELVLRRRPSCILNDFVIDAQGSVYPCGSLSYERPFFRDNVRYLHPRICIGTITEQPLKDIINTPAFVQFRKGLLQGRLPCYCRECLIKDKVICR